MRRARSPARTAAGAARQQKEAATERGREETESHRSHQHRAVASIDYEAVPERACHTVVTGDYKDTQAIASRCRNYRDFSQMAADLVCRLSAYALLYDCGRRELLASSRRVNHRAPRARGARVTRDGLRVTGTNAVSTMPPPSRQRAQPPQRRSCDRPHSSPATSR